MTVPSFQTMLDVLNQQAEAQPDHIACHYYGFTGETTATYQELQQQAHCIAACLQEQEGYAFRERVMLLMEPGIPYIAAFWGCLYAGLIAVPAYPPLRQRHFKRLQAIIDDAQAQFILTSSMISQLANFQETPLIVEEFLATTKKTYRPQKTTGDDIAFLQYTSGSTGHPKGVMVTHNNLLHNLQALKTLYSLPEEKVCSWLPPYHDMGLIGGILYPIFVGAPVFLFPPIFFIKDPLLWLRTITEQRITTSCAPNFAYTLCAETVQPDELCKLDLSSWKISLNGAEPIRAETLEHFASVFSEVGYSPNTLCPAYGMAETTLILSGKPALESNHYLHVEKKALEQHQIRPGAEDESGIRLVSCGPVIDGHKACIVHPETKQRCNNKEIGEIWVQGPSITKGYWGREELSQEMYQATLKEQPGQHFFRTGDLGFIDEQGNLYITGRWKDLLIVKGRNIHPHDLEDSVSSCHPDLLRGQCAVFQLEDEAIVAVQETSSTAQDHSSLFKTIQSAVAEDHEVRLQHIVLIKPRSLPKTSSGKIQRNRCRDLFLSDELKTVAQWEQAITPSLASGLFATKPSSYEMLYQGLAGSLAALTGVSVSELEPDVPFASLGLDSTLATHYSNELSKGLNLDLPITALWQYPNLGELSRYLAQRLGWQSNDERKETPQTSFADEPIAIVGMACRLPGSINSPEQLWQTLLEGKDCIGSVPTDRWEASPDFHEGANSGGFLDDVASFDAPFFNITPREAVVLDPQQRLALEVSWEALEHAGIDTHAPKHQSAGVFVGVDNNDYRTLLQQYGGDERFNPFAGTGNALSAVAGRIAYHLNWQGPAVSFNTACSSSLVATHQAVLSLQQGECDLALVGGCNILLDPIASQALARAGMLAPDGRCKTFDEAANGYVRGEGAVFLVLRRLSDAEKENDTIYASIRGSAVNQDGRSNGFTAPHGNAQAQLYRKALAQANVSPADVSFVETHGTGTVLGDAIELQSLYDVYGAERQPENPLHLGAIKTNLGHLESAAGITGLLKTTLCLFHKKLPKNLHLSEPNTTFQPMSEVFRLPQELTSWTTHSSPRRAAVSSFGFTGTNAHVVMEEAPLREPKTDTFQYPHYLLPLSAHSPQALRQTVTDVATRIQTDPNARHDLVYTLSTGRTPLKYRSIYQAESFDGLQQELTSALSEPQNGSTPPSKIAFLFTGQGSQHSGMCKSLEKHPVFREAIESCLQLAPKPLEKELRKLLFAAPSNASAEALLQQTKYTQPALFSMGYSLTQLWKSWGIVPDIVMGHSVGEYVAAVTAGVLSMKDGFHLIVERGRLMHELQHTGSMIATNLSYTAAMELVQEIDNLDIGAINGPNQIVLSGEDSAVEEAIQYITTSGMKARHLSVSHGFHSCMMEPMLPQFHDALQGVTFHEATIPWVCNTTGQLSKHIDASYWVEQIRQPVMFYQGMQHMEQHDVSTLMELGPQPILLSLGKQCVSMESAQRFDWLPSLHKEKTPWAQLFASLGELYLKGYPVDWNGLYAPCSRTKVAAPTYPFQRQPYWFAYSQKDELSERSVAFSPNLGTPQTQQTLQPGVGSESDKSKPLTRSTLQETLTHCLSQLSGQDASTVEMSTSFSDQGLTSLHLMELWYELFLRFPMLASHQEQFIRSSSPDDLFQNIQSMGLFEKSRSEHTPPPTTDVLPHPSSEQSLERSMSVLSKVIHNKQEDSWSASMNIPQSHPFFFDHAYDHVPGVLFVEGISQLVKAALSAEDETSSQELHALSLSFETWGELDGDFVVSLQPGENNKLSGQIFDQHSTPPRTCVAFEASYSPLQQQAPISPNTFVTQIDSRWVHKDNNENVLIGPLSLDNQGRYCSSLCALPSTHPLAQESAPYLSMTHLLEASRQCMTAIAHRQGESMSRVFVLLSSSIHLEQPIPAHAPLEFRVSPFPYAQVGERSLAKIQLQLYVKERWLGQVQILGNTVTQAAYQTQRWGQPKNT